MKKELDVYTKMIMAMSIFKKYDDKPGINTDDFLIYAGPHPSKVPSMQVRKLKELGWTPCPEHSCFVSIQ